MAGLKRHHRIARVSGNVLRAIDLVGNHAPPNGRAGINTVKYLATCRI